MMTVTERFYQQHSAATIEYLKKKPGCYLTWELHRAIAPDTSFTSFQRLVHNMAQSGDLEKRKLGASMVGYCLPGYAGPVVTRDASYYARQKIEKLLPGSKPQHLGKIACDAGFGRNTVLSVLKELVAQGIVKQVTEKNRFKTYEWADKA